MKADEIIYCKTSTERGPIAFSLFREQALESVSEKGFFSAALSGGTGPLSFYSSCVQAGRYSLPWESTGVFLNDDRCVAADHKDSNTRLLRENLTGPLCIDPFFVPCISFTTIPAEAALQWGQSISQWFAHREHPVCFDVIVLGMGPDGHTASLFPHSPLLEPTQNLVGSVSLSPTEPILPRVTMTLSLINSCKCVIFLCGGKEKRSLFEKSAIEGYAGKDFPASLVRPKEKLIWIFSEQN